MDNASQAADSDFFILFDHIKRLHPGQNLDEMPRILYIADPLQLESIHPDSLILLQQQNSVRSLVYYFPKEPELDMVGTLHRDSSKRPISFAVVD